MLTQIEKIANVGRLENFACAPDVLFKNFTLVYGENGSGKSTFSDIMRSLSKGGDADIILGRRTLGTESDQEIVLDFDFGKIYFTNGSWSDLSAVPEILIFDSRFINDNVYSGDVVTSDHMKQQYSFIIGEHGKNIAEKLKSLTEQNNEINGKIKTSRQSIEKILSSSGLHSIEFKQFLDLDRIVDIEEKIKEKQRDLGIAQRARELKSAQAATLLQVPDEAERFKHVLHTTIGDISSDALKKVRSHIEANETSSPKENGITLEAWLKRGLQFKNSDSCVFCGQALLDRSLIDSYSGFFSESYLNLSEEIEKLLKDCEYYTSGNFRDRVTEVLDSNNARFEYWNQSANVEAPNIDGAEKCITGMDIAAKKMKDVLSSKAANMVGDMNNEAANLALQGWEDARRQISVLNKEIEEYNEKIDQIKNSSGDQDIDKVQSELNILRATEIRFREDTLESIEEHNELHNLKDINSDKKSDLRDKLRDYSENMNRELGEKINKKLRALNAGFSIHYEKPNFRGNDPSSDYNIVINDFSFSPKAATHNPDSKPHFKNTLSSGDKSSLALALFLAQCDSSDNLGNMIVIFDDPFTSLDNFRRQFTAMEIRDISDVAKQVFVLSHEKSFLRLLWEKVKRKDPLSVAFRSGGGSNMVIDTFDIEKATQPRNVDERDQIERFASGEMIDPYAVRKSLRSVCEFFFRGRVPAQDGGKLELGYIADYLDNKAPDDHPYKRSAKDLRDINEYSRSTHHGLQPGNPHEESEIEEIKGFCRKVLAITSGM